jgi:hypothetical protein
MDKNIFEADQEFGEKLLETNFDLGLLSLGLVSPKYLMALVSLSLTASTYIFI